jgi:hypothetical protein
MMNPYVTLEARKEKERKKEKEEYIPTLLSFLNTLSIEGCVDGILNIHKKTTT